MREQRIGEERELDEQQEAVDIYVAQCADAREFEAWVASRPTLRRVNGRLRPRDAEMIRWASLTSGVNLGCALRAWLSLRGGSPALRRIADKNQHAFVMSAELIGAAIHGGHDAYAAAMLRGTEPLSELPSLHLRRYASLASAFGCAAVRTMFEHPAIVTPALRSMFDLHDALRAGRRVVISHRALPQHAFLLAKGARTKEQRRIVRKLLRKLHRADDPWSRATLWEPAFAVGLCIRTFPRRGFALTSNELDCALTHDQPRALGLLPWASAPRRSLTICAARAVNRGALRCLLLFLSRGARLPSLQFGFSVPSWAYTDPAGLARIAYTADFVAAAIGARCSPFTRYATAPRCTPVLAARILQV